jgi:hypothetical protein
MTEQTKPADEKDEAQKLTPKEEAELKSAATRGAFIREVELQGRTYVIGTVSAAADKFWNRQKVIAKISARKELRDDLERLAPTDKEFPFFISDVDVDTAAVPDVNTAYIATHLRTIDGAAVDFDAGKVAAEGMEGVIRGLLIAEIESMYVYYRALLIKLQIGINAKKSSALAKSSTNS